MKKQLAFLICFFVLAINAQDLPKKIEIPPVNPDPNVRFEVLHFDSPAKDRFSVIYYYFVGGSVMRPGEFVQDTSNIVFKDKSFKEQIDYSNSAVLLKRQVLDGTGKQISADEFLLAQRALEGEGPYKLYFRNKIKDPVVANRTQLIQSIYNPPQFADMTEDERSAISKFCAQYIPVAKQTQSTQTSAQEKTIADDILSVKKQVKSLHEAGMMIRGDIPGTEKVLTSFTFAPGRSFLVTKGKGDATFLKFYVTEDYKKYDCLDSAAINGVVQLTSYNIVYDLNAVSIGAFVNFHYKTKDDKGEDLNRQYSFTMDQDFKIYGWIHSTGKDKLNSLAPEISWFEGNKLYVLSNNREKIFKTYVQVHEFEKNGPAKLMFPANDTEKGSEKTTYANTFQPPVPLNTSQVTPIPDKYVPLKIINSGSTRYFIAQGTKYNDAIKATEYFSINIYRFESGTKLTNIDILGNYRGVQPFPMESIARIGDAEYFLLQYPIRVHLGFTPEKSEITQLTDDRNYLVQNNKGNFNQRSPNGGLLLKKPGVGNKMTILYYGQ